MGLQDEDTRLFESARRVMSRLWYSCFRAELPYHAQSLDDAAKYVSQVLQSLPWLGVCYVDAWPILQYAQLHFESRSVTQLAQSRTRPTGGQPLELPITTLSQDAGIGQPVSMDDTFGEVDDMTADMWNLWLFSVRKDGYITESEFVALQCAE
ncbi:hypothetical protein C8Q76DRAFT_692270 [Earliella scabrosa]|nr:hypothetical protein C8Q76DRAFT_692270 [Earliella scabrosa]